MHSQEQIDFDGWVLVYSSNAIPIAEIVNQMLISNGIESVLMNRQDTMYPSIGEAEVFVSKENALVAEKLIKELEV
jgi:hypothetical protein